MAWEGSILWRPYFMPSAKPEPSQRDCLSAIANVFLSFLHRAVASPSQPHHKYNINPISVPAMDAWDAPLRAAQWDEGGCLWAGSRQPLPIAGQPLSVQRHLPLLAHQRPWVRNLVLCAP